MSINSFSLRNFILSRVSFNLRTCGSLAGLTIFHPCACIAATTSFFRGRAALELPILVSIVSRSIVHLLYRSTYDCAAGDTAVEVCCCCCIAFNSLKNPGLSFWSCFIWSVCNCCWLSCPTVISGFIGHKSSAHVPHLLSASCTLIP